MSLRPRYVPILKGRQGEFNALGMIEQTTRRGLQPLIEVIPSIDRDDSTAIRESCDKTAARLGKRWQGEAVFLDAGRLDLSVSIGAGGAVAWTCRSIEKTGVRAIPVARLDDPDLAWQDVAAVDAEHGRGVCIRIIGDDLDEDPDNLHDLIIDRLTASGVEESRVDLLFDATVIDSEIAARGLARILGGLLRELRDIDRYRTVTIAGGAFPVDLNMYNPWVIGEHPRFDADMWAHVMNRRRHARSPDYGDYAIAHPLLGAGMPYPPAPQLRYATADSWLILKGRRKDPTGHEQFYKICDMIASHPEFVGAGLGAADWRIANARADGPGDATTWRQIGTAHHLDLVVARLTRLGEP